MSSLTTSYSMYFNRTYGHVGPVFQNRFKSILIENDSYFLTLSRYIYLNPVKAGLVKDPLLYQFSTLKEAVGKEPLHLLDSDIVRLIGERDGSKKTYEQFIYDGIDEEQTEIAELFEKEEASIGSRNFATRSQRKHLRRVGKQVGKKRLV